MKVKIYFKIANKYFIKIKFLNEETDKNSKNECLHKMKY